MKDLFDTAGLVTTYGSILFAEHVPSETSEAVRRLEAAGYANVGKANLHEFAYGTTSENEHFGAVPNPSSPGHIAGGSSGGSAAALAAGLADAALGTDSGGSIRIPSACCGTVGFKPTWGLVPLDGCFPLAPSFDHAGPMARDVASCERMLEALAPGFGPRRVELEDVEVGVAWTELADPLVRERVEAAAALFPHRRRLALPLAGDFHDSFSREVADVHRELFLEHAEEYGANVSPKIERCLAVTDAEYERAVELRKRYREQLAEAAAGVDLVLTPTLVCVAPPAPADELALRVNLIKLTFPFNAAGWPAVALPCGPAEGGLPASVQLAVPPGADALVLGAAAALERALSLD
ncbi:MAG: aspartyl-tRNA(Asn)/glutamyl-tRNA(Gln) amidotransferase subunit [Gaiellaceae bacterium]|nr:aspartyl-tRNA(Asn)/glutamyl-tRNA(Gln) amidotransferase subunit [Gaiellaceae bacterium]